MYYVSRCVLMAQIVPTSCRQSLTSAFLFPQRLPPSYPSQRCTLIMGSAHTFSSCSQSNNDCPPPLRATHLPLFFTPASFFLRPNDYQPTPATSHPGSVSSHASYSLSPLVASDSPSPFLQRFRKFFR